MVRQCFVLSLKCHVGLILSRAVDRFVVIKTSVDVKIELEMCTW